MSVPDTVRHSSPQVVFESYPELGFNYRMTDIQAAVGREQLKRLPEAIARRREMAARYRPALADIPGLVLPAEPEWARTNWQSYCVRLPEDQNQREVMQKINGELMKNQVTQQARDYFSWLTQQYVDCESVVLGCTEYPLVLDKENSHLPIVNPVVLQTKSAVNFVIGEGK